MAKKAKKIHTKKGVELKIVNPDAAGIDIADYEMQVCVPADRDGDNNRRFGSFTRDLNEICSWLKACKIKTAAMEATGIYWIPLYFKLKEAGIDVILVNAREVKNIAEKKTDEADAEWLMLLHTYGLLKASYQPENEARKIRNLTRHRNNILKALSKEVLHMQKAMEQMNVKLSNVLSDIVGKSGMAIIEAILNGERNPANLAQLADARCKCSREDIALSLEGTWSEDHIFELKQAYDLYKYLQGQMIECDKMIEQLLQSYTALIDTDMKDYKETKKHICKKNAVAFNLERYGYATWGVNTMSIPGMSSSSLLQLIGELGHDFVEKFDTPAKFCKWCNLVPNNKISGGKLISSRVAKRKKSCWTNFQTLCQHIKRCKKLFGNLFQKNTLKKWIHASNNSHCSQDGKNFLLYGKKQI